MIDDKKIEEAAISKCGFISSEFYSGAKWMQEELLKDLWNDASEKPTRKGKAILFNCIDHNMMPSWCVYPIGFNGNWNLFCNAHAISRWLYIDDLFPKKGVSNND